MTPQDYLKAFNAAHASVVKAEERGRDAEAAAKKAQEAHEAASLSYDRADQSGDPFALEQAKETYRSARKEYDDATARVERARAGHAAAVRHAAEMEAKAWQVFDAGADDLRRKVRGYRAELETEWLKHAEALAETGRKIAALARAVPAFSVRTDPLALISKPVPFGGEALDNTLEGTRLPKFATSGLDAGDRLVSREKLIASVPAGLYPNLAVDHAALRHVADLLYRRNIARSAAE